jgi:prophage maintenance system killer protein
LNGWKLEVDADKAHRFLIRLLETGKCDFEHLLPWVRRTLAAAKPR